MANEMLKFRKGTHAQIMNAAKVPGTIYIAKDEKAMYVDIDTTENGRIRIGDFIRVATVEGIQPPFSTSALYYVEADNALLKYVETEVEGVKTGEWKQVNGTDDLKTELSGVKNRVSALEGTVGSATSGLVKDMADAKTAIAANASAIGTASVKDDEGNVTTAATGLHALVEENAADIDAAADRIKALEDTVGTNEDGETLGGRVNALESDMSQAKSDISALQTASAQHVTKTEAEAFAKTADIEGTLAKVDTTNGVTAAIEAAVAVEKSRAELAEKALDDSIKTVKATADGAVQSTAFETWKTENTTAINNAKNAAIESANGYTDGKITDEITRADGKYATKLALESTDSVVSGHTNTLATLTGTGAGSVAEAKKAAEDAMAEAQKKTTMAEVEAKDYATKAEAQDMADGKDAAIATAQNAANAAQSAADDAQADADTALEAIGDETKGLTKAVADNAAAAAKAQKTADDYATAHAEDYTNAQIDSKVKAVSDVVAEHTGTLATLTSTDPTTVGSVAEAKAAADKAQGDIDAWKTAHEGDMTNEQINAAIKVAKDAADAAQGDADANAQSIQTLQGAINTLNGAGEGSVSKAVADAEGRLNTEIANKINAANAMDYKGGVASEDALFQKTNVKVGDTYVATTKFTFTDGAVVYPGDLIIAQGTEENGVIADPTWDIVHTGYDASLEQTITTADGKIQLTSAIGANNGQVAFVPAADSSATVAVANNTVTIGMAWEDFE